MTSLCWSHLVTFSPRFVPCVTRSDQFLMNPTTQNVLRECADHLIQTADLIACSPPAASTTTASTAAPAITVSTSTTASPFQTLNSHSRPNNGRRPLRTNRANLPYSRGQMWTRTFVCLGSSSSSQLPTPAERVTLALNNFGEKRLSTLSTLLNSSLSSTTVVILYFEWQARVGDRGTWCKYQCHQLAFLWIIQRACLARQRPI